ncbi:hypothetical protein V1477_009933 [Vespula maculifrons]|uniref:Uncharacterized protein n=1 Tax=Vespula maculifrons TaxID=7453 RepID=A0ABD2CC19_VESMC
MQQPPRGGTWVGSTFVVTKFHGMEVFPSEWLHISRFFQDLFYSHSDTHVSVRARLKVLPGTSFYLFGDYLFTPVSRILESRVPVSSHDRSCLDMSEADGVDGGAICKRGFIHLQFAEKPEAPERESNISSKGSVHNRLLDANTGRIGRTRAHVSAGIGVVFSGAIKSPTPAGPQMQQPPRGGTWVGSTCHISKSISNLYLKCIIKLYILAKIYN